MSEQTHAALEEALRVHIADEIPGALTTGFVMIVASKTDNDFDEGLTRYPYITPIGQEYHTTLGLTQKLKLVVENDNG